MESKEQQVCYYFLYFMFVLIHFSLGPPGPAGNDGLPGGKLIIKILTILILC